MPYDITPRTPPAPDSRPAHCAAPPSASLHRRGCCRPPWRDRDCRAAGMAARYADTAPCSRPAAKRSTSACDLSLSTGKSYFCRASTGVPPSCLIGGCEQIAVRLMMTLELHGQIEHRFLQQTAFGTDLIGGDALLLGGERAVQDLHVSRLRVCAGFLHGRGERLVAGQQCDRRCPRAPDRSATETHGGRR